MPSVERSPFHQQALCPRTRLAPPRFLGLVSVPIKMSRPVESSARSRSTGFAQEGRGPSEVSNTSARRTGEKVEKEDMIKGGTSSLKAATVQSPPTEAEGARGEGYGSINITEFVTPTRWTGCTWTRSTSGSGSRAATGRSFTAGEATEEDPQGGDRAGGRRAAAIPRHDPAARPGARDGAAALRQRSALRSTKVPIPKVDVRRRSWTWRCS